MTFYPEFGANKKDFLRNLSIEENCAKGLEFLRKKRITK